MDNQVNLSELDKLEQYLSKLEWEQDITEVQALISIYYGAEDSSVELDRVTKKLNDLDENITRTRNQISELEQAQSANFASSFMKQ